MRRLFTLPVKALNFHIYFRASDRTLTNEEVDREVGKITRALDRDFRTTLRN